MGALGRYLLLTAKAKTGLSPAILILAALAIIALVAASVFLCVTAYVYLKINLGELWAAVAMLLVFVALAIILAVAALMVRRNTMQRAQEALASRASHGMFDSSLLTLSLEIGRSIGWRRLVPIAAITVIAAGVAKEWGRRDEPKDQG